MNDTKYDVESKWMTAVFFADPPWLIAQLEIIEPPLNEHYEGHCQKATAAQSISEFIRRLTCSRQYRLIITGLSQQEQMRLTVTSAVPAYW